MEISETYRQANILLSEELKKGSLSQCIHLTGELRALSDPFHRKICRHASSSGERFFFLGYVHGQKGTEIMDWFRTSWASQSKWPNRLSAFSLIAEHQIELACLPKYVDMQFSLFNKKFVLLQAKHQASEMKNVWLLDSPTLNNYLYGLAASHRSKSKPLDANVFRNELLTICSPEARDSLWHFSQNTETDAGKFDPSIMESLQAAGLIELSDAARITSEGRDFLLEWR